MSNFDLITEPYHSQIPHLPEKGRHILAHYDDEHIVVFQAYRPEIGHFAAENGYFGDEFSLNRMTWIKPGFLWMMHRSGWATKPGQEVILAIWLTCAAFDAILKKAVWSSYQPDIYDDEAQWQRALEASSVRLQWDPDYDPSDTRLERRAIQIGLGGKSAAHYAKGGWIQHIEDVTDFVREQSAHKAPPYNYLLIPEQRVYWVYDAYTRARIGVEE